MKTPEGLFKFNLGDVVMQKPMEGNLTRLGIHTETIPHFKVKARRLVSDQDDSTCSITYTVSILNMNHTEPKTSQWKEDDLILVDSYKTLSIIDRKNKTNADLSPTQISNFINTSMSTISSTSVSRNAANLANKMAAAQLNTSQAIERIPEYFTAFPALEN